MPLTIEALASAMLLVAERMRWQAMTSDEAATQLVDEGLIENETAEAARTACRLVPDHNLP